MRHANDLWLNAFFVFLSFKLFNLKNAIYYSYLLFKSYCSSGVGGFLESTLFDENLSLGTLVFRTWLNNFKVFEVLFCDVMVSLLRCWFVTNLAFRDVQKRRCIKLEFKKCEATVCDPRTICMAVLIRLHPLLECTFNSALNVMHKSFCSN